MNQKVTQIVEKIKEKYPTVDTILLFGSAAHDGWTTDSDIDIFLIAPVFNDEREDIVINEIPVEIQKDNFTNIAKDMEAERGQLLHRNVATMMDESQIISTHSPAQIESLKSLAADVLKSAPEYADEDVTMWKYSIEDYLGKAARDLVRGDSIAFYIDTHYVVQNALELTLATHGVYMPKPKRLSELLRAIAPEFHQIFLDFASEPDPYQKLEILKQLSI